VLTVVTGASGLLGGNLALLLLEHGHRVRATRRSASKIDHLGGAAIEWVSADLADRQSLEAAFAGADVVFHCAATVGIGRRVTDAMWTGNVEGTANVIDAAQRVRVSRLVHCSSVSTVGVSVDGRPCDERATWNLDRHGLADGYAITKHRAEELVRSAALDGCDAVIINPTFVLGPYDAKPSSGRLILAIARQRLPAWTSGINNFVGARDVAHGMILAWQKGIRGQRYILGGENLSYKEIAERIARAAAVPPPRHGVPRWLARVAGYSGDLVEWLTGREFLVNSGMIGYAFSRTFQFTSDRAIRELGYQPGSLDVAIRDAIAWFKSHRML
jgi:dihydroflavonol-4-reductase